MGLHTKGKIIVGMSGGVDSSVCAALLQKQGYEVQGVFIKAWENTDDLDGACPWKDDQEMVEKVCMHLSIPWETLNLSKEYGDKVLEYFFREYEKGNTPNPDIVCNKEIKFKAFLKLAMQKGAQSIATGHYAQNVYRDGKYHLVKGADKDKDQSYFLYVLNQGQLSHTVFPLGKYTKSQVRSLARSFNLPNADRKDSQGICFIGKVDIDEFLKQRIKGKQGKLITSDGVFAGYHQGQAFFTIGQRKGIGIGGGTPYYVAQKDGKTNTIVITREDDDLLYKQKVYFRNPHWIAGEPTAHLSCHAKIRYRQPDQSCTIVKDADGWHASFRLKQRAVTPGQSIVFYHGNVVLGGGTIY